MKRDISIDYQTSSEMSKASRPSTYTERQAASASPRDVAAMPEMSEAALAAAAYRDVTSALSDVATLAMRGRKLYMSEKGFWLAAFREPAQSEAPTPHQSKFSSTVTPTQIATPTAVRRDLDRDYVFKCGDYYLPLSFEFSGSASKRIVDSQLVDGPAAIEVVNKQPKTINVTVRIQPNPTWNEDMTTQRYGGSNMTLEHEGDGPRMRGTNLISSMLDELYEKSAIFEISNKFLNDNMGVRYVLLEKYSISPQVGSRIVIVQMDLRAIYVREEQVKEGQQQLSPTPIGL